MNPYDFAAAMRARLSSTLPSSVEVLDDPNAATRPLYCYLADDPGTAHWSRYAGGSRKILHAPMVVCVGADRDGARYVAGHVRAALTDWRVEPTASPMAEVVSGPPLTDGVEGDRRTSMTLGFHATTIA